MEKTKSKIIYYRMTQLITKINLFLLLFFILLKKTKSKIFFEILYYHYDDELMSREDKHNGIRIALLTND